MARVMEASLFFSLNFHPLPLPSSLHSRFIVYDVSQISMKYLLKMNFKYKW
jgi:hypothetical protein